MPFTGVPVVFQISDNELVIRGVSPAAIFLAGGANATISLAKGTFPGQIVLPASFNPEPHTYNDNGAVSLIDDIAVTVTPIDSVTTVQVPIAVIKSGDTPETFLLTLVNATGSLQVPIDSASLEIRIRFR